MGKLGETTYRRRLQRFLGLADDAEFLQMLWAVDALQSDRVAAARPFLKYPAEAATSAITSRAAIYKWELEVLANELLTTSKDPSFARGKRLDCTQFSTIAQIARTLRRLENAEYGTRNVGVLLEMHRIGHRQFEWQRGFFNRVELYRAARIYGGPRADDHFRTAHQVPFQDFMKIGFMLHGALLDKPGIYPSIDLSELRVDPKSRDRAYEMLSLSLQSARTEAKRIRNGRQETAYRPSILRRWPLLEVQAGEIALCPVVSLLIQRVSSGIFYDLLGASGAVWDEVGERFETYCLDLMSAAMTTREVRGESTYRSGKNLLRTPDILVGRQGKLDLIIECKAKRMPFEAKFGSNPVDAAAAGYKEMARAIVQIWRYVHDCRIGLVSDTDCSSATGLVLTLDNWLSASKELQLTVIKQAEELADADTRTLTLADRIPVAFASIRDLESALAAGTDQSLIDSVRGLTGTHRGYLLPLAQEDYIDEHSGRDLPMVDELGDVLPWWPEFE